MQQEGRHSSATPAHCRPACVDMYHLWSGCMHHSAKRAVHTRMPRPRCPARSRGRGQAGRGTAHPAPAGQQHRGDTLPGAENKLRPGRGEGAGLARPHSCRQLPNFSALVAGIPRIAAGCQAGTQAVLGGAARTRWLPGAGYGSKHLNEAPNVCLRLPACAPGAGAQWGVRAARGGRGPAARRRG